MIMNGEILLTVAEVGVAFAAFSGLASVLVKPRGELDSRVVLNLLQSVLITALLATAFALFPFLVASFGMAETATWRLSAAIFAIAWLTYWRSVFQRASRLAREGIDRRVFWTPWARLIAGLYLVSILGLLFVATGWLPAQTHSVYLLGLFVLLFTSGTVFVRLFLAFARGKRPAA